MTARILVVEDHALVRKGLIQILARQPDFSAFGEAANAAEALTAIKSDGWDLVLLDFALPDKNGIELLRELKRSSPRLPILVLTMYPEDQLAAAAFRAGASGYITKEAPPEQLLTAIRRVLSGQRYVSPTAAQSLAESLGKVSNLPHARLSPRELEVMLRLAEGTPMSRIATMFRVSVKTVSTYRTRLLRKMGMRSNAELTYYSAQHGLVTDTTIGRRWTDR
jgi:DNA-binding NarL/FixJ family response regulator